MCASISASVASSLRTAGQMGRLAGAAIVRSVDEALDHGVAPFWVFALRVAFVSFVPLAVAGVIGWSAGVITPRLDDVLPRWPGIADPTWIVLIGLVDAWIASPLAETALMLVPIRLMRLCRVPAPWIPVLSGVLWGWLHAIRVHWIAWGAGWSFLCFTLVLMRHESPSLDRAWIKVSVIHGIHNVFAVALELGLVALSVG
jgi:hypothetical protein